MRGVGARLRRRGFLAVVAGGWAVRGSRPQQRWRDAARRRGGQLLLQQVGGRPGRWCGPLSRPRLRGSYSPAPFRCLPFHDFNLERKSTGG